ncbi:hypothetical protein ACWCQ1_21355 [Streptomyces sp. NPDC002144]
MSQGDHTPLEPAAVELRSPVPGAQELPLRPPAGVQTPVAFVPFGEDDPPCEPEPDPDREPEPEPCSVGSPSPFPPSLPTVGG